MRRAISRLLSPASTSTRVPLATSRNALPVEQLPTTDNFITCGFYNRNCLSGWLNCQFPIADSRFSMTIAKNKTIDNWQLEIVNILNCQPGPIEIEAV